MKKDILAIIKICLLAIILLLLVYLAIIFNSHLIEIRDSLHSIKEYIKTHPVNPYPPLP